MPATRNVITGIFGTRGSGKTFIAAKFYGLETHAICYNTTDDSEFRARSTLLATGADETAQRIGKFLNGESYRISFRPIDLGEEDKETGVPPSFDEICWQTYSHGSMSLYIDEMHKFCSPNYAPRNFRDIVSMGRHQKLNLTFMTHRMKEIWVKLRSEVDIFIFFQMRDPRDLDIIEDMCGREVAEIVPTLRRLNLTKSTPVPGEYYRWDSMLRTGERIDLK